MMLRGEIDHDTCSLAVSNMRTYLVGVMGAEFETKLRRYEELVNENNFGQPSANGHDTSADPGGSSGYTNGHAMNGHAE
jgi:hypothetical protein